MRDIQLLHCSIYAEVSNIQITKPYAQIQIQNYDRKGISQGH